MESNDALSTNNKLVSINQLTGPISPLNSLLEACDSFPDVLVGDDLLVGTIRHRVDNSNWFIAQASFHIDQAVNREDADEQGHS